jgi:hypothetical protein
MSDNNLDVQTQGDGQAQAGDNIGDSTNTAPAGAAAQSGTAEPDTQAADSGANDDTAAQKKAPDFQDPNMQARFTQKMQELSALEKKYKETEQKAGYYEALRNDSGAIAALKKYYAELEGVNDQSGKAQQDPVITQDAMLSALESPEKFQGLVSQIAESIAERKIRALHSDVKASKAQLQEMALMQSLDDFANARDDKGNLVHADYETLEKSGKIAEYMKQVSPAIPAQQRIALAYRLAKSENYDNDVLAKAHRIVEDKKRAVGDKGTGTGATLAPAFKTREDFVKYKAKELGIDLK